MKRLVYRFYLASDDTEPAMWNHSRSLLRIEWVKARRHWSPQLTGTLEVSLLS